MPQERSSETDSSDVGKERRDRALEAVRKRIDDVDAELSALLNERFNLSLEVAAVKAQLNLEVKDQAREQQVLDKVAKASERDDVATAIKTVYKNIFACSRNLQYRDSVRSITKHAGASTSDDSKAISETSDRPDDKCSPVVSATQPQHQHHQSHPHQGDLEFPTVTIIGLGLIGGAIARLIHDRLPETFVIGVDVDKANVEKSIAAGAVNKASTEAIAAVDQSSLIVLAASPEANVTLLEEISSTLRDEQIVIDVTSVKSAIMEAADRLGVLAHFVGGHPLFGSDKSGFDASQAVTTDGAIFCLTPPKSMSSSVVARLQNWLVRLGLRVEIVDSQLHDRVLARTSHLVQLLVVVLGVELNTLQETLGGVQSLRALSGPSLRQVSRLMKSSPDLWCEIAGQNKNEILQALRSYIIGLELIARAIEHSDRAAIKDLFDRARQIANVVED